MSVLGKVLKGAALGSVMAGSAAMAQDSQADTVKLTRSEWGALQVVKNFNVCVQDAERGQTFLPSDAQMKRDYYKRVQDNEDYYNQVTKPYEDALAQFRDQNGYAEQLAGLYYRMKELANATIKQYKASPSNSPLMMSYTVLHDQYEALKDRSKAEFDALTTLQSPRKRISTAQYGDQYVKLIEGCTKQMRYDMINWMKVNSPNSSSVSRDDTMYYTKAQSELSYMQSAIKRRYGPATYLDLTQAPKP